jgi:hypothetical protein
VRLDGRLLEHFYSSITNTLLKTWEVSSWSMKLILIPCVDTAYSRISLKMKMRVFWDIAPCSLAGVDRRFRCSYCVHHQGDESHVVWKCFWLFTVKSTNDNVYSHGRVRICNFLKILFYKFLGLAPAINLTIFFCKVNIFLLLDELPQIITIV